MREYKFVFFDFDGTLVNTINGTRESALYALKHFNILVSDAENIGNIFCGPPLRESFEKYNVNDEDIEEAIKLYRKYQNENTIECNELYNGIEEMLGTLKKEGKKLIIVTAKLEQTAIKILKYLDIFKYFDMIVGATTDSSRITKKEIMKYAINNIENIDLKKSIMIGDRTSDIKAGIENDMDTIGVLYGMDTKELLENVGAMFLVNSPVEILNIIK
ncbi:MAG: HAD-IA family hydrolase [Clostridia bacterium]|nr:HAD-IA family hydrolase [Clostridia bacterium]